MSEVNVTDLQREAFEAAWSAEYGFKPRNFDQARDAYVEERTQGRYEGWKLAVALRDARIAELEAAVEFNRAPDDAVFGPGHPVFEISKENDHLRAEVARLNAEGDV